MPKTVNIPAIVNFRPTPSAWTVENGLFRDTNTMVPERHAEPVDMPGIALLDAWNVRERFLALRDEEDFLSLLNETGLFFRPGTYSENQSWRLSDFEVWQRTLIGFLRRRPLVWEQRLDLVEPNATEIIRVVRLHRNYKTEFQWRGEVRAAVFIARHTFSAMLATIYLDHLRGARFRLCARPDCGRPYEVTSKHTRRFCTQYCASFEALRRRRERDRQRQ
ncbi:MAG: hypothetical protein ACRDHZ_18840 [Ktedonobacteraceae bacterium]